MHAPIGASGAIFYVFIGAGAVRVLGHFAVLVRTEPFDAVRVLAPTGSGAWIPESNGIIES